MTIREWSIDSHSKLVLSHRYHMNDRHWVPFLCSIAIASAYCCHWRGTKRALLVLAILWYSIFWSVVPMIYMMGSLWIQQFRSTRRWAGRNRKVGMMSRDSTSRKFGDVCKLKYWTKIETMMLRCVLVSSTISKDSRTSITFKQWCLLCKEPARWPSSLSLMGRADFHRNPLYPPPKKGDWTNDTWDKLNYFWYRYIKFILSH